MKRLLSVSVIILLLAAALLYANRSKLASKAFERAVAKTIGVNPTANLEDGLHVYVCGAGSPLPDPKRSGPCLGVLAGDQVFIFDTGTGGVRNLGPMGFPVGNTQQIFLSHLHSDHIDGLGETLMQIWINGGKSAPTPVTGPKGTSDVVGGFNQAYKIDAGYRTAHHGESIANPAGFGGVAQEIDLDEGSALIFNNEGVKITAFTVSHEPVSPAFGFRIDYKDRSVAFSGDTSFDPAIAAAAKDVDVLFHEALNKDMVKTMQAAATQNNRPRIAKIFGDILDYHATPIEAAKTAQMAEASDLVLYHIVPPLPVDGLKPVFLTGTQDHFDGKITVSEDGLIVRLLAGQTDIVYIK